MGTGYKYIFNSIDPAMMTSQKTPEVFKKDLAKTWFRGTGQLVIISEAIKITVLILLLLLVVVVVVLVLLVLLLLLLWLSLLLLLLSSSLNN